MNICMIRRTIVYEARRGTAIYEIMRGLEPTKQMEWRYAIPSSVLVELAKALHTTPNYLLLGDIEEDDWMDDMIQILQKNSKSEYRELAKKQIELIANIGNN